MHHGVLDLVVEKFAGVEPLLEVLSETPELGRYPHTLHIVSEDTLEGQLRTADICIVGGSAFGELKKRMKKNAMLVCCLTPEEEDALVDDEPYDDIWLLPLRKPRAKNRLLNILREIRFRQEAALRYDWLDTLMDTIPDMVWFKDVNGAHLKVNQAFCKAAGKTKKMIEGRDHAYIWDVKDSVACDQSEQQVRQERRTCQFEEILTIGSQKKHLRTYKSPIYGADKAFYGTVGIGQDITNLLNLNMEIELFISVMPFPLLMCDAQDKIVHLNQRFLNFFNEKKEDLLGMSYRDWKKWAFEEERSPMSKELVLRLKNDDRHASVHVTEAPVKDVFGNPLGLLCIFRDVTAERELADHVWRNANMDSLTGLANRHAFGQFMDALDATETIHLLYVDMDNFKQVNDRYGHETGDFALQEMARAIREIFPDDMAVRLGGDEFLVCVKRDVDIDELKRLADALQERMISFFSADERLAGITLSIGIRSGAHPGTPIDQLIKEADQAMYQAKNAGKGQYSVWEE